MFYWRETVRSVELAVTDRVGGVSQAPYDSLNLALHVGDDPDAVTRNRGRVAQALEVPDERLVFMDQCHGGEVAVVSSRPDVPPAVDALVTADSDLALVAMVADCVPVLLWDDDTGVIAAAHAGRPGLLAGVVPATIETMRGLGARSPAAVVGPAVCGRCYEVPAPMRDAAAAVLPEASTVSWTGTPAIDVAAGVVTQLRAAGVAVRWVAGCSREDERLYSHRRSGVTGRFGGVILRRST